MNINPWLVDSIKAFLFFNCPECTFRTKEENLFAYHAAKNHALSTAFFDKQIELEQSTIGLKTVEYSPDLDSKSEEVPTRVTNEFNDPLECDATNVDEILDEDFDENFDNGYENVNSGTDEPYESIADDNWLSTIKNSGIKDELSQSATKPGIWKNEHEHLEKSMNIDSVQEGKKPKLNKHLKLVNMESKTKGENPFKCTVCKKTFALKISLTKHIMSIHEEKSKPSTTSNRNYSIVKGWRSDSNCYLLDGFSYVKNSMSSKTIYLNCNERNNKENSCEGYANINRLTDHMFMKKPHNHEPRHNHSPGEEKIAKNSKEKFSPLCDICGKVYKSQKGLKSHRNHVHDKFKPFECTICNKSFGHKGKLKVHIRTVHQKLRLHKCTICDKLYKEKVTLTKHEYAVHGDGNSKPYNCNDCDSRFTFNNKLTRHMKNVHNKTNVKDTEN